MDKQPTSRNSFNLVDPNDFVGQSNSSNGYNVFVPLEDLSISVELTTNSKPRSLLTLTKEGSSEKENTNEPVRISFIEGSEINGKKFLTTKYTDLRDVTSSGDIDESLGITNIDIDFNSAYAPQVTINFVDVRGGAIFQNAATSKYSVLFKMPYPIFRLKIKGYYGKPVSYCLHLTKVNSKFNSQNGNFEITANFVGYTYAMLTDMLVGYLKGIPETTQGKIAFKPLAAEGIIPLGELISKMGDIDAIANKLSSENKSAKDLSATLQLKEKLSKIEGDLIGLKTNLSSTNLLPENSSVIVKQSVPRTQGSVFSTPIVGQQQQPTNNDVRAIEDYKVKIEADIDAYNAIANNELILNKKDFLNIISYLEISRQDLFYETLDAKNKIRAANELSISDDAELTRIINNLNIKLTSTDTIGSTLLDIYDLTKQFTIIKDMTRQIYDFELILRKELADALRDAIKAKLGFDPSIRNIFKIITKHIEVFLQILYDVSSKYKTSKEREKQLDKFKCTKRLDVKCDHDIYPWPEYNNEYNKEQYLGAEGVVEKPLDIPEVAFVEDFYRALIVEAKKEKDAEAVLSNGGIKNIWYGVNPLDTIVFNSNLVSPYKRVITPALPERIASVVLTRAITYLAVSNRKLSTAEIEAMAVSEAARLCEDLNGEVKNNLIAFKNGWDKNKIKNVKVKLGSGANSVEYPILKSSGDNWEYIFRSQNSEKKFIPVDKGFGIFSTEGTSGTTFLTNYNAAANTALTKPTDSGIYVKIVTNADYEASKGVVSNPNLSKDIKINLQNLQGDLDNKPANGAFRAVGFNPFGSTHGVQEFRSIDWGSKSLNNLDLRYVFYANDRPKTNGLCGARVKGTDYDFSKNSDEIRMFLGGNTHVQFDELFYESDVHPSLGKNRNMAAKGDVSKIGYPLINYSMKSAGENFHFSLFGSRFYYEQTTKVRALLFLHSFPWNGVCTDEINNESGVFSRHEIINLFAYRAGFVQVPKLWPAFIGSLLWRYSEGLTGLDPIIFANGSDIYLPLCDTDTVYPTTSEYLASNSEFAAIALHSGDRTDNYRQLDATLKNLPQQAKNEFIKAFEMFVSNEWDEIRSVLEIIAPTESASDFVSKYNTTVNEAVFHNTPSDSINRYYIPTSGIFNRYKNLDNYVVFTPISLGGGHMNNNILLELKQNSTAMNMLITLFNEPIWVANTQWNIWGYVTDDNSLSTFLNVNEPSISATTQYSKILVSNEDLDVYLNKLMSSVNAVLDSPESNINQKVFGINENDEIKLNIYRTLKAIYDKWIAGTDSPEEILFQCGQKLPGDYKLAEHRTGVAGTEPALIDSFRFVTRAFQDIGDDFLINPQILNKLLVGKSNQSVYALFSDLLKENNFDFVALPSYINYNDPNELKSLFKPYPYMESIDTTVSGPSFVCVYVGQASTKLDFGSEGNNSMYEHPNDGVDFTKDGPLPSDFQDTRQPWEEAGAAFMVNFGHQNQNIFKDVTLDQNEFTETSESLQIMDDIANMTTDSQKSYVGQNLYNVWSVRSYKAQVEMLGNAMVQPMMYFQLNNIPMFHGAYLITSVKHNIKPNHMTTTFSGTRIKHTATPLIDAAAMYTSLLADYKPPVLATNTRISDERRISQVNGTNARYVGYVTRQVVENDGLVYQTKNAGGDNYAIKEVGDFMELLATRWHSQAKNKAYTDILYVNNFGRYGGGSHASHASHSENSKHGVGLAVDLRPMAKDKTVGKVVVGSTRYDRSANVDFIRFALDLIKTDGNGLAFDNIILNDSQLISQFSDKNSNDKNIVISSAEHENHIHFEFDIPDRIVKRVEQGYLSEDNIITSTPEGTAVKVVQPRPVGAEINKYLGQI